MSQADVHAVICPHRDRELERLRDERPKLERLILALRRRLRETDPSLPNEFDGNAWAELERGW